MTATRWPPKAEGEPVPIWAKLAFVGWIAYMVGPYFLGTSNECPAEDSCRTYTPDEELALDAVGLLFFMVVYISPMLIYAAMRLPRLRILVLLVAIAALLPALAACAYMLGLTSAFWSVRIAWASVFGSALMVAAPILAWWRPTTCVGMTPSRLQVLTAGCVSILMIVLPYLLLAFVLRPPT